ncbi:peroxiredoxin [Pseudodesulfovibrio tunisiensis]|uniref:peroxiredoxin n=1 Tax=Pseudodesulfovibrio tunisiensis TaxID=463192 RepID=UPI001FB2BB0D|nr:redoxin domain-containing protein [Pseudodesulfovibrio tunisiensis]
MSCGHDHEHEEMLEFAKVGQKVPEFTLEAFDPAEGAFAEVDLGELREQGKWVILFFYPADFTFVCPTELADLASRHADLVKLGAEVVSVSTDTKFTHMAWKADERMLGDVKFRMAADPTGAVSRFFDVWDYETGLALRGTFIINPEGVLVSSEVNFYNVGRNADELFRKMEANTYLIDHPAEACPAKWTPGEKTLTPGEKLVGKVYEALNDE